MENFSVKTKGICSSQIDFSIEDGKLHNINFHGGCPGNLAAIGKILEGTDAKRAVMLLKGNDCGGKNTSCADQLARGVEKALMQLEAKA
ncbi:uncharacterized protein TIGR03905 [Acetitomaculum ruminis DSM 5522]|uniref:ribonucleoside-diphosphate reductase n=1 Tax=Acetitomaculum ruminis DSM 5522 TaxID=1120918 RepID=A0A1I0WKD5_9FIRM|nr:TIGR03905 family TSCPD domain-containing protein [Acetitomaculum ruminis]SFA89212.1 uncharacterized protein TIGR03905 [Acetitomaculum ruminis DSM 5522]